jgi:hypothetical protein
MLSHEQAAFLRFVQVNHVEGCNTCFNVQSLIELGLVDSLDSQVDEPIVLTDAGKQALAEYDAETKRLFTVARCHSFPFSGLAMLIIDKLERHVGAAVGDSSTTPLAIVECPELERLQALERKIGAFFDGCYLAVDFSGAAGIVIDKGISIHMARYNEWDVHWPGGCCRALPSSGAMRKAFELFEVPGEEA